MIKYIWQLPQHLLALLVIIFSNAKYSHSYNHTRVYYTNQMFGVSLGNYIIVYNQVSKETIKHEYGHSIQSLYTGPLYLLIIGLPSITMNILTILGVLKSENYYKRWPENQADKLGNVNRS